MCPDSEVVSIGPRRGAAALLLLWLRRALCVLVPAVLIYMFASLSVERNSSEVWFANPDQDATILMELLWINSGHLPTYADHPSLGLFLLYSPVLHLMGERGMVPVWKFEQLYTSSDPLLLLPGLFYGARPISVAFCILCAVVFGAIFWSLSGRILHFAVGTSLLLLSGGLFFQSLVIRSELVCVLFLLLSFFCLAWVYRARRRWVSMLWVFLAGLCLSMSYATKVQVLPVIVPFLAFLYAAVRPAPEGALRGMVWRRVVLGPLVLALCARMTWVVARDFRVEHRSMPVLYVVLVACLIAASLVSCVPRLRHMRVGAFAAGCVLVVASFFVAIQFCFFSLNFENREISSVLRMQGQCNNLVRVLEPFRVMDDFKVSPAGSVNPNPLGLNLPKPLDGSPLRVYARYYVTRALLPLVFGLLIGFVAVVQRRVPSPAACGLIAMGAGVACMNSMRLFEGHYLIFSDVYFGGAAMLLWMQICEGESVRGRRWGVGAVAVALIVVMVGVVPREYSFLSVKYSYGYKKNSPEGLTWFLTWCNTHCNEFLVATYGSLGAVSARIRSDSSLNGSDRGMVKLPPVENKM